MEEKGQIIFKSRGIYRIYNNGKEYLARSAGDTGPDIPVVGDFCLFHETDNQNAVLTQIIPRKSFLSRNKAGKETSEQILAANMSFVFVVLGLDRERSHSQRLLERLLTLAWNSGAVPVVLLNKADLHTDPQGVQYQIESSNPGVDVLLTSAETGEGCSSLKALLSNGKTGVFIGPSGVGKSALTNTLLENRASAEGVQRPGDLRGRHTTTAATLFFLKNGGGIIDSPGIREIQLWAERESLDKVFSDIQSLSGLCRFKDCRHEREPGCAVKEALNSGTLDTERYRSYQNLVKELDYLEKRKSEKGQQEIRVKDKNFGKMVRDVKNKKVIY